MFDFRSDTVTRPSPGMLRAMADAPLGDDVLGDDPSVCELQERVADLLGKEAGLFVPSGTMSNLIALYLHCKAGEEVICEEDAHIHIYEQAGYAQINGMSLKTVRGERGIFTAEQLQAQMRDSNVHFPEIRAVAVENTHNRGGGSCWPKEKLDAVCETAKKNALTLHLDGARLMNAVVATGISAKEYAAPFDTVSLCFSKGLGAPIGSVLLGSKEWIRAALRRRKVLGGGMRQVGVLAAAALYALEHNITRLAEDHENAKTFAEEIRNIGEDQICLKYEKTETNMVFFDILAPKMLAEAAKASLSVAEYFSRRLAAHNVKMNATGAHTLRAVTHLNLNATSVANAVAAIKSVLSG